MASASRKQERKIGLARVLSKRGYCSRSKASELIRAGRVRVNGVVRRDPEWPVHESQARVEVDASEVASEAKTYLMMNKPAGVVTTASDEKGRATVYDHMDGLRTWVAPVGRLDKASEGLLLLTNDSEWGARVSAPASHLDKTYHVQIGRVADESLLRKLSGTIQVESGERLRVKSAELLRSGQKNSWLTVVLDEGKNRQIRRIFEALDIEVLRLVRVAVGPLALGGLAKGEVRKLSEGEKQQIDQALLKVARPPADPMKKIIARNSSTAAHHPQTQLSR